MAGELLAALRDGDGLTIDLSGLTGADMTVLQLLVAARKSALALGKPIGLTGTDGPLRGVLERAGFIGADGQVLAPEGEFWTGSVAR